LKCFFFFFPSITSGPSASHFVCKKSLINPNHQKKPNYDYKRHVKIEVCSNIFILGIWIGLSKSISNEFRYTFELNLFASQNFVPFSRLFTTHSHLSTHSITYNRTKFPYLALKGPLYVWHTVFYHLIHSIWATW
jgi:hypothetical protein